MTGKFSRLRKVVAWSVKTSLLRQGVREPFGFSTTDIATDIVEEVLSDQGCGIKFKNDPYLKLGQHAQGCAAYRDLICDCPVEAPSEISVIPQGTINYASHPPIIPDYRNVSLEGKMLVTDEHVSDTWIEPTLESIERWKKHEVISRRDWCGVLSILEEYMAGKHIPDPAGLHDAIAAVIDPEFKDFMKTEEVVRVVKPYLKRELSAEQLLDRLIYILESLLTKRSEIEGGKP